MSGTQQIDLSRRAEIRPNVLTDPVGAKVATQAATIDEQILTIRKCNERRVALADLDELNQQMVLVSLLIKDGPPGLPKEKPNVSEAWDQL